MLASRFADQSRPGRKNQNNQINEYMKKLLTLLAVLCSAVALHAGEYPDISITELKTAIAAKKVTLLDANGSDSYNSGHIPGAIDFQIAKAELAAKLPSDKSALVVAYCAGPTCGAYAAAAKAAQALGYTNIKHLSAGISGWKDSGSPIEK